MSLTAARLLVFFTSAAVLVLEILAGRLMAPFVGITLETFTGIIGTVLAGISLGAWLGGRAADERAPQQLLGPILIAGGVLSLLAPTIVAVFGPILRGGEPLQIVLLAGLAFFLPALVLSAVTPVVVKLQLNDLAETGTVVGRFSAVGTAGAIFGTFFTGFVLIAALPSRPIVFFVGAVLVVAGIGFMMRSRAVATGALVAIAVLTAGTGGAMALARGPCESETTYYCARITTDEIRPSGRVLWLDTLRHSYIDLEDPTYLQFRYSKLFEDIIAIHAPAGPLDALYIGGGGFTLPRWLSAIRAGSTNTVLEIDEGLVSIAEQRLGLDPAEIDAILIGDARLTLRTTPESSFDLVVGDAFGGPSVRWHLTTAEFMEDMQRRLRPGGMYVMNMIDYPPIAFAKAMGATLDEVFEHVLVAAPPDYLDGATGGNFVFAASDQPFDAAAVTAAITSRDAESIALTGAEFTAWVGDAPVLTDEFAPVDQLISRPSD